VFGRKGVQVTTGSFLIRLTPTPNGSANSSPTTSDSPTWSVIGCSREPDEPDTDGAQHG
jgi:hypothetical protein